MKPGVMLFVAPLLLTLPAPASPSVFRLWSQESASPQPQELSKKSGGCELQSQPVDSSAEERKKAKKVWTNDNLNEVRRSAVSQVGNEKNRAADKSTTAKLGVLRQSPPSASSSPRCKRSWRMLRSRSRTSRDSTRAKRRTPTVCSGTKATQWSR